MEQSGAKKEYFIQDKNGKIIKVIQHSDIKKEPNNPSVNYSIEDNSGGTFSQNSDSSSQFMQIQKDFDIQPAAGSKNFSRLHSPPMKYQIQNSSPNKIEEKVHKYVFSSNGSQATNSKSKPTTSSHQIVQSTITRRRKPEKAGKGLRHFSMKVCEKVKEKGTTTYNEVADELVAEEVKSNDSANCDQKNIRRRVYDALNVLMAMNIILKDKKEIRWIGLPANSIEQCTALENENKKRRERIEAKSQQLKELFFQQIAFKGLIERNMKAESQGHIPTPNSSVQLPFIVVNTHKSTRVNCSVTNDKSEYFFKFDDKFEIHDDIEVMKRMGLLLGLDTGNCTYEDLQKAKSLIPKNFGKYMDIYAEGGKIPVKMEFGESLCEDTTLKSETFPESMVIEHSDFNDDDIISESSDV